MWKNLNHLFDQPIFPLKQLWAPRCISFLPLLGFPLLPRTSPDLRRSPQCPKWRGALVVGSVMVSLTPLHPGPQHSLEGLLPCPRWVMRIFVAAVSPIVSALWKCPLLSHVRLHGLWLTRLLCPWDFSGKAPGVGSHFLLQGLLLNQGSNPSLWHWQVDSLPSEPPGKPALLHRHTLFLSGALCFPRARPGTHPSLGPWNLSLFPDLFLKDVLLLPSDAIFSLGVRLFKNQS